MAKKKREIGDYPRYDAAGEVFLYGLVAYHDRKKEIDNEIDKIFEEKRKEEQKEKEVKSNG